MRKSGLAVDKGAGAVDRVDDEGACRAQPPRLVGAFADIGAGGLSSLELFISSRPLRWAVGNSNWTATAFTWLDSVANVLASYTPGQGVIFDDVAGGASPVFVTNTLSITTGGININCRETGGRLNTKTSRTTVLYI